MGEKKEAQQEFSAPAKPSFEPTTFTADDVEVPTRWRSAGHLRKRRRALCLGGCCAATVVILGLVILILALTVFRVRDAEMTMNSIRMTSLSAGLGTFDNPISVNATLIADISIKNPNAASFKFDNSTTVFYYKGEEVGLAYAPDGEVGADRTVRMNVTVDVLVDRVVIQPNVTSGILGAGLDLSSHTEVSGQVDLLGLYRRRMDIVMNCTMTVDVLAGGNQEIKNKVCQAYVQH